MIESRRNAENPGNYCEGKNWGTVCFLFFFITEILSEEGLLAQSSAKGRWRNRQAKATWDRPCVGLVGI